jgi:hypothetical protein
VTLLGRFTSVHLAATEGDAEALVLRCSEMPRLERTEGGLKVVIVQNSNL